MESIDSLGQEPLFRDRTPAAAARQCATVLAWLTECQLAMLAEIEGKASTSKAVLHRQQEICETAVRHCAELRVPAIGLSGLTCPRLAARLDKLGSEQGQ